MNFYENFQTACGKQIIFMIIRIIKKITILFITINSEPKYGINHDTVDQKYTMRK